MEKFLAESAGGRQFKIRVYVHEKLAKSLDRPVQVLQGTKEARTSEGYHCNFIDDNTWEIVELGLKVKKLR